MASFPIRGNCSDEWVKKKTDLTYICISYNRFVALREEAVNGINFTSLVRRVLVSREESWAAGSSRLVNDHREHLDESSCPVHGIRHNLEDVFYYGATRRLKFFF